MTKEQQRIKLAEWDGWKVTTSYDPKGYLWSAYNQQTGEYSHCNQGLSKEHAERVCLPDYLNDLNATVELIKKAILGNAELERAFIKNLNAILDRRADDDAGLVIYEYEMAQITAAPDEFCEALLKTLGLWEETK